MQTITHTYAIGIFPLRFRDNTFVVERNGRNFATSKQTFNTYDYEDYYDNEEKSLDHGNDVRGTLRFHKLRI